MRIEAWLATIAILMLAACGPPDSTTRGRNDDQGLRREVRACSDSLAALITTDSRLQIRRMEGRLRDHRTGREAAGARIEVVGSTQAFPGGVPLDEVVREMLASRGWQEDLDYAADGPDGTSFAFRRGSVLCLVRAAWDGGDDSDPAYIPSDRYELQIDCIPAPPD